MKLPIQKSFRLLKFLNKEQPAWMRAPIAGLAFLGAFAATGRLVLAREVAHRCWVENDFKLAMRRLAWYSRRSWLNVDVSQDDFFDLTEGLSDAQLAQLEGFVEGRKAKMMPITYAADKAYIAARRLDNNTDASKRAPNLEALRVACDTLLSQNSPPVDPSQIGPARSGDFPIDDAKQTMADFVALFPPGKIPWFAVSGTFLGLIREKGFLPHDYDIDLGLFEDQADIPAIRQAIFDSDRFVLKKYDHHQSKLVPAPANAKNPEVPYILKVIHVSGVHIDIFIHYRDAAATPEVYWHGSSLHRWENSPFDLVKYDFYEWELWGPSDPDQYLTENYGDWRTPVSDFNCTTDTANLALVRHPIAVVIFLKRLMLNWNKDPAAAAKLKSSLLRGGYVVETETNTLRFSGSLFGE